MNNELIKYWGKRSWLVTSILWLVAQILFITIASILIKNTNEKLINILLITGINSLILLILFGFSVSKYTFETVYQIQTKNTTYKIKFYRYLLILFAFAWLLFFITNAFYMLINGIVYNNGFDYFNTLSQEWWKLLIITFFNIVIIIVHRELMNYTLTNSRFPWKK